MNSEDVSNILLSLASGARTFAGLSGDSTTTSAVNAATGLLTGVVSLLRHRTPEEAKALIYDLTADPADKVDLDGLDADVAAIIARRRAEEG